MGTMPINKLLLQISVPMMVSMIVQALYNIVDSLFVSYLGENQFTALSLAFSMQNLMIAVAAGTGVGVNALLSKSLGEKNQKMADRTANNAITLYALTYVVFLVLGLTVVHSYFSLQLRTGTTAYANTAAIIGYGEQYLSIVMLFSFGLFAQFCMERLLVATGRAVYSMITQLTGAVINIILDPIFIFGLLGVPKMGVRGAAIATVLGQIIAACLGLFLNLRLNKDIHLRLRDCRLKGTVVRRIYAIGVPSIVMGSISSVMNFVFNQILVAFSTTAVAVFGAYFKLQSFVFMPVFGLNNGMVPIVGYNYGARKRSRILKTIKSSAVVAICIMAGGLLLFECIPGQLLKIFSASDDMLKIGIPALRIIAIHFVIAGGSIVMTSAFQALGNAVYSLIISVSRQLVVLLPVAYLLSLTGNLDLVWLSFPIAEIVSFIMCCFFMRVTMRKKLNFPDADETAAAAKPLPAENDS